MVRTFFRKSANPRVRAAVLEVLETRQFFDATLTPTADTFVRDGTSAGNVYGSYALLQSKQGAAGVQRQIYEKFDLSGLSGSISHATLQIYGNRSNTNDSTFSIAAAGMSDNSWSEASTTWNNKPAVGSTLNTASVTSTTKGLINLDVTSYLQQAQTNGQTTVSIAIVGTANTDAYFEMSSREGTNSPQLILTTGSTAPAAPTNLTAPSVQTNAVTLNWADNSNNETGFQVQRKQGTGAWATLTTTSANAISYIDTTVSAGQSYSYQVIAVNAAGSSASSNTVNASVPAASTTTFTPTADTYVRDSTFSSTTFGTSGTAAARLSTTSTNNRQIYLKFDLSSLSGSVSSATLNVYGYRSNTNDSTFAIAAAQMSDNSWTESSTDWDNKPTVGSTISTANVPNTSYQWISLDVSSYIQAAKANNQSVVSIAIVGPAATTDYFTMLTRESQNAPQLVVASSTTTNAPTAPGNVVATGASSKTVHVTWNDVATNETGYQVQYRLQGSPGAYTSLTLPAGSTSADITNLTAGTAYELQVTALGSTNSAAVAATASTLAAPVVTASSPKQEGASITLGVDLGSPAPNGVSYAWTLTGGTLSSTTAAAPTFTPADDGSYTAAVTVTYANGDTAAASRGIAVLNVAPMLTIAGNSTISTGQSYPLTVNHSDPGTDTIQSWAINWGDGSAVQIFTGSTPSPTHIFSTVGTYTISATATDEDGTFSAGNTLAVNVTNNVPTVATAAAATPNPASGTTASLSVLGADDGGESNLTYTWSATGPAAVTFSPANGTNLSKNTTATFAQAGTYTFIATISDGTASTTSSVTVVVNRTPTSIAVSPTSSTVSVGSTEQFSATASDQFGQTIATPPAFSWTVSNGTGTVSSSGVYTAFASSGSATVTAAVANAAGNASITLTTTDGGSGPGDGGNGGDDGGGDTGPTDPPSTPKALLVKPKFDGGIILSWDESSTMVDSYLIQRSDNGQAFVDIGTIDANNKTFFDTSLSGTHNYQYRAAANNAFGTSSWSEPIASSIGRPGDVDHQFGIDGSAVTHFGTGSTGQAYLVDFLPEPDGKIIELGQVTGSLVSKVTRINSDGSIDTGFGDNGLVTLPASFETPYRTALALDSQGGILIAGRIYATNSSSVLRLTNAGTIDGSFSVSDAGQFGALAGSGPFLDIEAIGTGGSNIYVVARVSPQGSTPAATYVFAFHEDGRLDLSFGQGGKMRLASYVYNGSLVIDKLKQLYIAGTSQSSQYPNGTAVAQRVFASGAQDFSYGNNGVALGNLTLGVGQFAYEIALDSHGRLIISGNGSFVPGQLTHGFLVRLNSQGVLDSGFASGGIYSFQGTAGEGVAVDSLSQIYLTVQSVVDSHYHDSVFSLDQLGDINTSFGNHGSIDLISNVPSGQLRIDNANRLVTGFYFLDRNIDDPTLRLTRIFLFGQTGIYADSNNDGNVDAYEATTGSDLFDISTIGQTGKIIKVNDDDTDQDGVPDYADGFSPFGQDSATPADDQTDGESFTPIEISIPTTIDPQTAHFTFTYSGSDPMNVNRTGDGSSQNPFVYTPAGGAMRIWTVDGDQNRDGHSAGSGGDYIVPGVAYTAAQLGMPQGGTKTFYIEGIAPRTAFNSDQEIKLTMTDGDVTVDSSVRVTIAPNLIRTDGNRDGTVSFDAKDDKEYYFWKNNNLDGNADIDGVSVPQSLLPIDGHNGNDSSDQTISDARDLQDFMHVEIGVPTFFNPADYTLRLHWDAGTYSDGAAGINAFEVDQNTADNYLKDSAVAQSAITGSTFLKRFTATDDYDFGAGYVVLYSGSTGRINLLIEGVSIGDGTLTAEWVKNSHAVVQDAIHLKIRSVESMYDEYSNAVGSGVNSQGNWTNGDPTAGGTAQVPQTATLVNPDSVPDMATSSDYIVFVPGWNNREADRISSADTAFKRLFWSGFTGHFALFSWPTQVTTSPATDPGNFDRSEFIALESAVAFNDALQKIKTAQSELELPDGSDKLTVLAHSQGNYVLDEALRTASKKLVDNAIMSQAAVSSDLFDASSALPTIYTGASPNSHDKILNGNRTYDGMPAADGIGGASPRYQAAKLKVGHLVNFFNPNDFALAAWDLDQSQKPSSEFNFSGDVTRKNVVTNTFVAYLLTLEPAHRYFNGDAYRVDSATGQISYSSIIGLDPGSGQPIYSLYAPLNLNSMKALHEAMAFAVGSDGQAVGENCALGVAQGFSDVQNINLLSSKFDDTRAGHSAQFYYDMPTTASYWAAVLARSKA